MDESDISALKETLCAQQNLLQKLYSELEAEREASATSASEALSVILRLQGEKAAIKMEAEQYKRLSEEKISHVEESLSIVEDAIYQKEMEVAALDHQVQAYRYKLLSMGCTDTGLEEMKILENTTGEASVGTIGRRHSAPVFYKHKKKILERESCGSAETDLVSRIVEEKTGLEMSDSDKKTDDSCPEGIHSYWEQMRRLEIRVKEIAGGSYMSSRRETRSPSPNNETNSYETDQTKSLESRVHDVFEVPRVDEDLNSCEKEDVHPDDVKMDVRDDSDMVKKVLQFNQCENKLCQTSDIDCRLVVVQPRTSVRESHQILSQVNRASEIVEEGERMAETSNRDEELRLLNEIKEKLDSLHHEIRSLKVEKPSIKPSISVEPSLSLSLLSEAMLHFWL